MEDTEIAVVIYWKTRDEEKQRRIRERFGISNTMNINRETRCRIRREDMNVLMGVAEKGYIEIRNR